MFIFTFSNGLELPKPKMRRCPWESVQAKLWPSGVNLQSKTAPCPCPSIWKHKTVPMQNLQKDQKDIWLNHFRSYSQLSIYHVKEVHHSCSSLQIPHVHISIMTSWQHDPGVERMWLQDKHLSLVALKNISDAKICCHCSTSSLKA